MAARDRGLAAGEARAPQYRQAARAAGPRAGFRARRDDRVAAPCRCPRLRHNVRQFGHDAAIPCRGCCADRTRATFR